MKEKIEFFLNVIIYNLWIREKKLVIFFENHRVNIGTFNRLFHIQQAEE